MPGIKHIFITVPAPVSIGVRKMAFTGAVWDSIFRTFTDLMSIRAGMGMDAGTVTGKSKAIFWDKPIPEGRYEGGETENPLESFFIIEGKLFMGEGVRGYGVSDTVMFIREFLTFARFFGRL